MQFCRGLCSCQLLPSAVRAYPTPSGVKGVSLFTCPPHCSVDSWIDRAVPLKEDWQHLEMTHIRLFTF